MISFPNTTNQGGKFNNLYDDSGNRVYQTEEQLQQFDVSRIKSFNMNLNATFKKEMLNDYNLDISRNSFRTKPRPILGQNFTIFNGEPFETVNSDGSTSTTSASKDNQNLVAAENPFMIPASILSTVNRYNRIYKTPVKNLMNAGAENTDLPESTTTNTSNADSQQNTQANDGNQSGTQNSAAEQTTNRRTTPESVQVTGLMTKVVSSVFNPTHVIQVNGLLDNLPLMNMMSSSNNDDWIYIGDSTYLGLNEEYNKKNNNNGVSTPISYNSWEVILDDNGYVRGPKGLKTALDSQNSGSNWKYDPSSKLIYTDVTTGTGKDAKTERKYFSETKSGRDFITGLLGQESTDGGKSGSWVQDGTDVKVKINWDPFSSKLIDNSGNCTIRELVRLSHTPNGQLGMSKYKYADFLFCKNIGKVSNNHMITLRRFAHPVGDNIFRFSGKGYLNDKMPGYHGYQENAPIGTLITWFGTDDNKLEDILNYSVKSTWKELTAEREDITSEEDNPSGGLIGMFANSFNPAYNSRVAQGMAGSNSLWNKLGSRLFGGTIDGATGIFGGSNAGADGVNSNSMRKWELMRMSADKNKIYTPQNTIQATHKYEGRLELSHEFTLNFSYRLRALDVMNPKTVMLDLLGNILEVTYNRGHFWGGERRIIGPPRNASTVATANAFIDSQWDKLEGFVAGFANGTLDWKGILGSLSDAVNSAVQAIKGAAEGKGGFANLFVSGAKKLAGKFVSSGASKALLGQLKNQLGRPAVYVMNSLLDGSPVGLWHVTIGNPKNPIAAFGNLILTNTKITHSGPLGFDDFPTELKVSCTLKHGRSRDLSEVARMYTKGVGAFYNTLDKNKLSEFFTVSNTASGREVESELLKANYAQGLAEQLESIDAQVADLTAKISAEDAAIKKAQGEVTEMKKKEQEQAKAQESAAVTSEDTKDTSQQKEVKSTTQSSSSSNGSSDTESKQKEIEEHKKRKGEYESQLKKLTKNRQSAYSQLSNNNINKYVKNNYSSIYGDMNKFTQDLGAYRNNPNKMINDVEKLYTDYNQITDPDYYRRGHFIRDHWALRYETLGQDLDTEGRILIDENA